MSIYGLTATPLPSPSPTISARPLLGVVTVTAAAAFVDASPSATLTFGITGGIILTAAPLTTSSPVIGAPALVSVVALSAASKAVVSPIVGAPVIEQINLLSASLVVVGSPALDTPTIGQIDNFTALALALSPPQLDVPSLGIIATVALSSVSLPGAAPAFSLISLTINVLPPRTATVYDGPVVETGFRFTLLPSESLTQTAGKPPLFGVYPRVSSPVVGAPTMAVISNFTAASLAVAAPQLSSGNPVLMAASLTVSSPVLDTPSLPESLPNAAALAVGSPTLTSPTLDSIVVALTAVPLSSGSVGGGGFLGLLFVGGGGSPTTPIGFGSPILSQVSIANNLTTSAPVLGAPVFQYHALLIAVSITGASPSFTFLRALTAGSVVPTPPVLAAPTLGAIYPLTATDITVPAPVLGQPGSPLPAAASLAVGSPSIGSPTPGTVVAATGISAAPAVLGHPALAVSQVALVAASASVSPPVLDFPTLAIIRVTLDAASLTVGIPVLGVPAPLGQPGFPVSLTVAPPELGSPTFTWNQPLSAASLTVGSPVLGRPTIAQLQALTAAELDVALPAFGAAVFVQIQATAPGSIAVAAPVIDAAGLGQVHNLVEVGLLGGGPQIDAPSLIQSQVLTATSIETAIPAFGQPNIGSVASHLDAAPLTAARPEIGASDIAQFEILTAASLSPASPVFSFASQGGLQFLPDPVSIETDEPIIGVSALFDPPPIAPDSLFATTVAASGNSGNGTITGIGLGETIQLGNYTVSFSTGNLIDPSDPNSGYLEGTFIVADPDGQPLISTPPFYGPTPGVIEISFTFTSGTIPMVSGDIISIVVASSTFNPPAPAPDLTINYRYGTRQVTIIAPRKIVTTYVFPRMSDVSDE